MQCDCCSFHEHAAALVKQWINGDVHVLCLNCKAVFLTMPADTTLEQLIIERAPHSPYMRAKH